MSDPDDMDTIPPPLRATALGRTTAWSERSTPAIRIDAFGLSDRGKVRNDNQDHFYLARLGRFSQTLATSLPAGELPERLEEDGHVAVVADGMGGHAGGEYASAICVNTVEEVVIALETGGPAAVVEGPIIGGRPSNPDPIARHLLAAGFCQ